MASCDCTYMGGGAAWMALESAPGVHDDNWVELAHSAFSTTGEAEEIPFPNVNSLVGGDCEILERITAINFSMTVHNYCPQVLAAAFGGTVTNRASAAVVDEVHRVYQNKLLPFDQLPDTTQPIAVNVVTGGALIPDTEYARTAAGLIPNTTLSVADGTQVQVDYQRAAATVINTFKTAGNTYSVLFPSTNLAGKKGQYRVLLRRAKVSIANEIGWKSEAAPTFTLSGKLLADPNIPATDPESPYVDVQIVEP